MHLLSVINKRGGLDKKYYLFRCIHELYGGCFCETVDAFVFLPWDLNEFDLEAASSTLYFFQLLLHSFISTLIITVDLTCYHLGIAMYDHVLSTRSLCEIQTSYQGFIFRLVVGCGEI